MKMTIFLVTPLVDFISMWRIHSVQMECVWVYAVVGAIA